MICRLWRTVTGHYAHRRSRLFYAMAIAEIDRDREPLDGILREIRVDGDMQHKEFLLLTTLETA